MCILAPPPCEELTTEPSTWQLRCGCQGAFMPAELDVLPLLQDKAQDQSGLLGLNFIWDRAILTANLAAPPSSLSEWTGIRNK